MNEIWTIFMGGIINSNVIFRKWSNFEEEINNGVNLNKIGYKKFFEKNFRGGELLYFTKSWIHIVLDFDHFL